MTQHSNQVINSKKALPYAVKGLGAGSVKDVDLSKRIVTGFFSTCYVFDDAYDVILPGATAKSIRERGPQTSAPQKIKHLKDHDWGLTPGKILVLEERTIDGLTGTYFESKLAETTLGIDMLINYQEGIYDNHSIGYRYMDGEFIDRDAEDWQKYLTLLVNPEDADKAGFMYVWKEIMMREGSTVAFGCNALTPFLGVKSGNPQAMQIKMNERIDLLVKQLYSGKQSDEMLYSLEMQLLQLKQLNEELFAEEPSIKDTLKKGRPDQGTPVADTYKYLTKNFKLT